MVLYTTYNLHQRYLICCQIAKNKQQLPTTVCWLVAEFPIFNLILPELILVGMVRCSAVSWLQSCRGCSKVPCLRRQGFLLCTDCCGQCQCSEATNVQNLFWVSAPLWKNYHFQLESGNYTKSGNGVTSYCWTAVTGVTSSETVTVEGLHLPGADGSDAFGCCFRAAPGCHSSLWMCLLLLQQCTSHGSKTTTCVVMLPAVWSIGYIKCMNYISDYHSRAAGWFLAGRSPN